MNPLDRMQKAFASPAGFVEFTQQDGTKFMLAIRNILAVSSATEGSTVVLRTPVPGLSSQQEVLINLSYDELRSQMKG